MGKWALDVAFVWKAVLTLGLVLLYYCFSIGITFYNKWLTKVGRRPGRGGPGGRWAGRVPSIQQQEGMGFGQARGPPEVWTHRDTQGRLGRLEAAAVDHPSG